MAGEIFSGAQVRAAIARVAARLVELGELLNRLDGAVGDGDLGITAVKGGAALSDYIAAKPPGEDLGAFLSGVGMAFNRAASSTFGSSGRHGAPACRQGDQGSVCARCLLPVPGTGGCGCWRSGARQSPPGRQNPGRRAPSGSRGVRGRGSVGTRQPNRRRVDARGRTRRPRCRCRATEQDRARVLGRRAHAQSTRPGRRPRRPDSRGHPGGGLHPPAGDSPLEQGMHLPWSGPLEWWYFGSWG